MKKLFLTILFALFSYESLALSNQSAINQYLKDKKLDKIEGIWYSPAKDYRISSEVIIYKYGNSYNAISIDNYKTNQIIWSVNKISNNNFNGNCIIIEYSNWTKKPKAEYPGQSLNVNQYSDDKLNWSCAYNIQGYSGTIQKTYSRVWPDNLASYNSKFGNSGGSDSEITFNISQKREQCKAIGFKPETEKFADCVLRLVELDVKQQTQTQIVSAESSGNNELANQLRRQNNLQSSQALINLGQQLMNPKQNNSNIYMPQTQRCTVSGFGATSVVRCY
jgi:hypothetical protein